jgi:uncharacterized protein
MEMRFLCDRHLGKLAKWLRILGYDTHQEASDRGFLKEAEQGERIALTRQRRLADAGTGRLIFVRADRVHEQIGDLIETLSMKPDPKDRMTLCLRCNRNLLPAAKAEVEEAVPAYVYQNCTDFRKCPDCGRITWRGTHPRQVEEYLRRRIPPRPL